LRVTPGAKQSAWAGTGPDGRRKVKVAAPAIEGRANAALVKFVAASLGLPRRAVRVVRGLSGRDKVLAVDLAASEIAVRLRAADKESG
jgi:uncharacterized protein YggU (UPF0235/DUF167 family)